MLRPLIGLNKADAIDELRHSGISISTSAVDQLRRCPSIKLTCESADDAADVLKWLQTFNDVTILSSETDPAGLLVLFAGKSWTEAKKIFEEAAPSPDVSIVSSLVQFLEHLGCEHTPLKLHDRELFFDKPLLMGILNVTPDSFSESGRLADPEKAYRHALEMIEQGCDIIDVGGESTRPGSAPVSMEEEWARVAPVIRQLSSVPECVISIDSYKAEVARRALEAGAHIINDISGLTFDPAMAGVAAAMSAPVVIMHIKGEPKTMQAYPQYGHLMEEIYNRLAELCARARSNGVTQIIVDPGVGFGKRLEDNFEIIRRIGEFSGLGYPLLLGSSRKSYIGKLDNSPPSARIGGSLASMIYGLNAGVSIFRVHDVFEAKQALLATAAIRQFKVDTESGTS